MRKFFSILFLLLASSKLSFAQPDVFPDNVSSPISAIGLTTSESVTVGYGNYGTSVFAGDSIRFQYSINNGPWVSEYKTLSAPFDNFTFDTYTFSQPADLSAFNQYEIKIVVSQANDPYTYNDTITAVVINAAAPMIASVSPFEVPQDQPFDIFINGIGTDFFSMESVYFIRGTDTIFITGNVPPDFPNFLEVSVNVACSKPKGLYDLHLRTTTDGLFVVPNAIKIVSSMYAYTYEYNPNCHNETNGSLEVIMFGGSQSYSYLWNTGSTIYNPNNLPSGTYTVVVTDDITGCTYEDTLILINPPLMTASYQVVHPDCGQTNGYAWATVSGGIPPYDIYWGPGEVYNDSIYNLEGGEDYFLEINDENGCYYSFSFTAFEQLTLNVTSTSVTCGEFTGDAAVTIANGVAPFSINWSNGDTGFAADSLGSGSYFVTATDANSCSGTMTFQVLGTNGPNISNVVVSPVTCNANANGSINLTITGGQAPYSFLWSNGATTEDITGLTEGTYQVTVRDASGCQVSQCINVESSAFRIEWWNPTYPSCGFNDGNLEVYTFGGVAPISFQWDAAAGSSTSNFASNLGAGFYSVIATDATGCTDSIRISLSNFWGPYYYYDNQTLGTCGGTGAGLEITPDGGSGFGFSVMWDQTINTEDLLNTTVGYHELSITDGIGCVGNYILYFPGEGPLNQDLCLVTVDSASNKNLIVWEKNIATNISHYNIYRETCEINGFLFVASVPYDSLSQYIDYGADPTTQSWKYKISAVDDCGSESMISDSHKTIHLFADRTMINAVDLSWDAYLGFSFTEQIIWRHHSSTGWIIIDTVPATQFTYTDLTTPSVDSSQYFIEVYAPSACVAERAVNHNSTRSNRGTVAAPNDASVNELENGNISVYPNPSADIFNLIMTIPGENRVIVRVFDLSGKLILSHQLNLAGTTSNHQLDMSRFEPGLYQVVVTGENTNSSVRIIKQ